jgi:DNA-binding protein YbaB
MNQELIRLIESNAIQIHGDVEYFAELVAAAEREACAKVCEMQMNVVVARHPARIEFDPDNIMTKKCAAAIRARGE